METKKGWDRGLDYKTTEKTLLDLIIAGNKTAPVLLVQLRNGSRVGEAWEATRKFAETGEREVYVRTEKRKDGDLRKMIIPDAVKRNEIAYKSKAAIKMGAQRLGFNTHSLRYAFVTKLAKEGISPMIISKITHHKRLDQLLTYTQQVEADKIHEKIAK